LIEHVIVEKLGERRDCVLGGFGAVLCGFCRHPFALRGPRVPCSSCGAKIVEVRRIGGRKFEGTFAVKT